MSVPSMLADPFAAPSQRQWTPNWISGQPEHSVSADQQIGLQPLAQQVRELETTLDYLGQPFSSADRIVSTPRS
ncbi:MAG: hypothetical protein M3Y57_05965, partial [Acidobacteriota bacterium]|nr:hypothetical protein [Acidobacteriota bacterium]